MAIGKESLFIWVSADLKEDLKTLAHRNETSVTQMVIGALEEWVEDEFNRLRKEASVEARIDAETSKEVG